MRQAKLHFFSLAGASDLTHAQFTYDAKTPKTIFANSFGSINSREIRATKEWKADARNNFFFLIFSKYFWADAPHEGSNKQDGSTRFMYISFRKY